ncbi:TPA: hypothetical protein N0F65_010669 [Lagenidium giganteum]|uniref:Uncharacterized protein n=1 Tax=Lagenidium giganteum TaxID=4803 RepID=A0AAV2Z5V7_9STRA|nr:TPA: hypothetical protein N0F65_010669 [Lagenidium giganteum]
MPLAFVLEMYWMTIQGKLLSSLVLVFNLNTDHHGKRSSNWIRQ